jgi:hypothetical protein
MPISMLTKLFLTGLVEDRDQLPYLRSGSWLQTAEGFDHVASRGNVNELAPFSED